MRPGESWRSSTTTRRLDPIGHADRRGVRPIRRRLRRRGVPRRVRGRRRTAAMALGPAAPVRGHHALRLRGAGGSIERRVAVRGQHRVSRRGPSQRAAVSRRARALRDRPALRRGVRARRARCAARGGRSGSSRRRSSTTRSTRSDVDRSYYWRRLWWAGVTRVARRELRRSRSAFVLSSPRRCDSASTRSRAIASTCTDRGDGRVPRRAGPPASASSA